ncbi:MAG: site-specific integrase [Phenylobacterium sp.]|uniref:tyrosine-type recombinase/integrase n=1 Tax=Phenylobacterium sp. TaxID=1871053 RepID=UPI00120B2A4F|nr:site-specific integrase [Phenylobacterium sp.]TAL34944.1 MAG: site-specific integrase [Phenylobacterium sp.]
MSVRKRQWTTAKGEAREGWVVDYIDAKGTRRLKTFGRKREADSFAATAAVEVREGVHVADSASVTVKAAGAMWVTTAEAAGLERTTLAQYGQHKRLHIDPFIGSWKLSSLSIPSIREFEDRLRAEGRSPAMIRKILVSLGTMIADAQERGLATRNPVRDMRVRRGGKERRAERRQKGKLRVGVHIPSKEEVRAIVGALEGRWRPLLLTAIFTGLRASELRGLRWSDLDLDRRELRVQQRADRFNEIGAPKSESGERTVPLPPLVANALKEWRLACPKGELGLVFPNKAGGVESHHAIRSRGLMPAQVRAGVAVATGELDDKGQPILAAKYTGLHALRHFYASWCINRQADGGLGLPLKVVQERMGHASVVMTSDVYGHLFPTGDDGEEMAAAEQALLG